MFCSKCGKEIANGSAHCSYCAEVSGQQTAMDTKSRRYEGMYSKEDYLTISEEYNKEKKEIEAKYKKKITTCVLAMVASFVLMTVFMCLMIANPMLGILSLVCLVTAFTSAACWQLNINKRKAVLEEVADTHYRKYINNYNSSK